MINALPYIHTSNQQVTRVICTLSVVGMGQPLQLSHTIVS